MRMTGTQQELLWPERARACYDVSQQPKAVTCTMVLLLQLLLLLRTRTPPAQKHNRGSVP